MLITCLLAAAVTLASPSADQTDADAPQKPKETPPLQLALNAELGGRLGATAGHVLQVPFAIPGPGLFFGADAELRLFGVAFVGGDFGMALGFGAEGDPLPAMSYRFMSRGGLRLDWGNVIWRPNLHLGVTSIALIPVPRYGIGSDLQWRFVNNDLFNFYVAGRLDLDLLVIVPAPGAELAVGGGLTWGGLRLGAELGAEGDAVVAIIANTVSGALYGVVTAGYVF